MNKKLSEAMFMALVDAGMPHTAAEDAIKTFKSQYDNLNPTEIAVQMVEHLIILMRRNTALERDNTSLRQKLFMDQKRKQGEIWQGDKKADPKTAKTYGNFKFYTAGPT